MNDALSIIYPGRQHAGDANINNLTLPNELSKEAIDEPSNSITGGLQNMLERGRMGAFI